MCEIDHDLRREPFSRERDASYRGGLELGLFDRDAETRANGPHVDEAIATEFIEIFEKRGSEPLAVQVRYVERSVLPALDKRAQLLTVPAGASLHQCITQGLDIIHSEFGRHSTEHGDGR